MVRDWKRGVGGKGVGGNYEIMSRLGVLSIDAFANLIYQPLSSVLCEVEDEEM